jgi:putative transposase
MPRQTDLICTPQRRAAMMPQATQLGGSARGYPAGFRPPRPGHPAADLSQQRIKRRAILGGLIYEYQRAA